MTGTGPATQLTWLPVSDAGTGADVVAVLALDRPDAANSFNDAVIRELVQHLAAVAQRPRCRALVLRGKGKHFSAGADLAWMRASAQLSYADNVRDANALVQLFEGLAKLPMPTLGVITGSAFGGAVGLTACCDVAIASDNARFSLSEIKLGIMPAVILPYLARKLRPGALRRLALTGRMFDATEALAAGLVERVVAAADLDAAVREELNGFLAGSPDAQAALKELMQTVMDMSHKQGAYTAEAIARMRTSPTGQAGLNAFFAKKPAPWTATLPADWRVARDEGGGA